MAKRPPSKRIDKSALTFGEPRRLREPKFFTFLHEHPCCVCGATPIQVHHVTFAQSRARGLKVSDEFCVPVCLKHHNDAHAEGDERTFWAWAGIDPLSVAGALWGEYKASA